MVKPESNSAITVEGVSKSFGPIVALKDVSLSVPYGVVIALLGPNGAGKTTLVRILTTLLKADAGRAKVAGFDVERQGAALRAHIGLAGQFAAVDRNLTGRENLEMVGRLYHLSGAESGRRADELLERFGLSESAHRLCRTYSGGMHRRLDLAASLVARPPVLFLDEPTTGLDPRSRFALWDVIRDLVSDGTTVLLTTQYMEEADRLADTITLIDRGEIIAEGTSGQLKARFGGQRLNIQLADRGRASEAATVLAALGQQEPQITTETGQVSLPVTDGISVLVEAVRRLDAAGIPILDLALSQPTLDEVFMSLTGRVIEGSPETSSPVRRRTWPWRKKT